MIINTKPHVHKNSSIGHFFKKTKKKTKDFNIQNVTKERVNEF